MSYTYKRGETWWVGYKDQIGRSRREKTAARTRAEAERLAQELEIRAERVRRGLEVAPDRVSWPRLCDEYIRDISPLLAAGRGVSHQVRRHLRDAFGETAALDLTPGDVRALLGRLLAAGYAPSTVEQVRGRASAICAYALSRRLLTANPVAEVPAVEAPERPIKTLPADAVPRVLAALPEHWRLPTVVAILAGLRPGEVAALRVEDVDLEARRLTISRAGRSLTTKTRRVRTIQLSDALVGVLELAISRAVDGRLFHVNHALAARTIRNALMRSGLGDTGVRFRDLRSTHGTAAYEATGDIRYVQAVLGHTKIETTERHYAALRSDRASSLADLAATHPALTAAADFALRGRSRARTPGQVAPGGSSSQVLGALFSAVATIGHLSPPVTHT